MTARLSQEYVSEKFEERGCSLLDTYVNKSIPVKFRCKCGTISMITYSSFRRGSYCLNCSGKRKKTLQEVKEHIEREGYSLLSKDYQNAFTILSLKCPTGHKFQTHWNKFQQGCRCPKCSVELAGNDIRFSYEKVQKIFRDSGCELLSKGYKNNHEPLKYRCVCGRISQITLANFQQGSRCKWCRIENMSGEKHPLWIHDRKDARLRTEITTKCFSALRSSMLATKQRKFSKSYNLLGYGPQDLRRRVESHPNWDTVRTEKWHLDHVFPIKAFCDYGITDLSLINCLENLRPVEGRENLRKHGTYYPEDFEVWLESKGYKNKTGA